MTAKPAKIAGAGAGMVEAPDVIDVFEEVTEIPEIRKNKGSILWNKFFEALGKAIVQKCLMKKMAGVQIMEQFFIENFCNGKPANIVTSVKYQLQRYNMNFKDEKRGKYYEKRFQQNMDKINKTIITQAPKLNVKPRTIKEIKVFSRKINGTQYLIFQPIFS